MLWAWKLLPLNTYISMYARTKNAIKNEVLEPITFVLAYPTVFCYGVAMEMPLYKI